MLILRKSFGSDDNLLIIGQKTGDFRFEFLSDKENEYVNNKLKNGDKAVDINQYNRYIFIRVLDGKNEKKDNLEKIRSIGAKMTVTLNDLKIKSAFIIHTAKNPAETLALAEGILLANYQFLKYQKDAEEKKNSLVELLVPLDVISEQDRDELNVTIRAVFKARDLINEPLSFLSASKLSEEAQIMGKEAGFSVEVLQKPEIEALEMGGLLAVNRGSNDPPTFSILEWKPGNPVNNRPIVLVGKGVVYDTGGISLKPSSSMDSMKSDMSGAAAVLGVLYMVASMKLPVHVIGLIPATDNMPDAKARVPGDIITMFDGTTVEVMNTDAEGRLILADSMAYAKKFDPALLITIATLTGSAANAIGKQGSVMMGTADNQQLKNLMETGEMVHERLAWFPFWPEYNELLKSDVADLKNIGGKEAGAITAGKFLANFTSAPFIHLDIAGTAYLTSNDSYRLKGGTGVGIRMLYHFLKQIKEKKK
ncbi:MAG: leucyl aminopeptidase family protein [Bacteroidota bacterium]